jgi:hypothetical protein
VLVNMHIAHAGVNFPCKRVIQGDEQSSIARRLCLVEFLIYTTKTGFQNRHVSFSLYKTPVSCCQL